jgi:hypothetical protein
VHKSVYEFFVAQSIIEETLQAQLQAVNQYKSKLNQAFLAFDLGILSMVGEHIDTLNIDE